MHIFSGKNVLPPKVDWAPTLMGPKYVYRHGNGDAAQEFSEFFVFLMISLFFVYLLVLISVVGTSPCDCLENYSDVSCYV